MDIRKLQRAIVDGLEDVKAQHISVFNTEHLSSMFERVIIASGTSNRQTKALASSVREAVRSGGMQVLRTEGEDNGEWIIVDCGAAVVHVMQPAIREYYHLEELWGGKTVRMKIGDATGGLVKASEDASSAAKKAPARKKPAAARPAAQPASARYAAPEGAPALAPGRAPARKAAPTKTAAPPARKTAAAQAVPKKTAPRKTAAGKTAAVKTLVVAPVRKTPTVKTARRTPARRG